MNQFLEKIRMPEKGVSLKKQILTTAGVIFSGFIIGILQKWLDSLPSNRLPKLLQYLDISNYFGRLSIWILLATVISIYSKTPLRASINTFSFLISMILGYYIYSNFILGFLPTTYMMIWIVISIVSFFMAYICWYAKGKGFFSIVISSAIIGTLFAQAFSIIHGFYIFNLMEVITWAIGVIILYRKPKELVIELSLSLIIAIIYQQFIPYFG